MAFIEAEFYKNESYIVALRERLREYATKEFDITLIDCPPSMGAFVYMAMIASDFIIVPIRAGSRFSLDGITKTINAINQIRRTKLNEGLVLLKFLYNMADLRRLADKHSLTILNNRYPGQVLTEYISEATMLRSSEMLSETVFQSSPRSKVAAKFRSVAREILAALGM
jgi:chromosome partitioning protein